ncbi:hypothetical protein [Streptomyces sp. ISL-11]|uniref:hypothetical protein n=1 Tax=Streptomyces sp. ISL-11 TaxID=2819174 RepID=UPI001BEA1B87|nr:hypothetical protein [Streptomyces sp. ISL-11]MBT2383900.1 hypothetical protein [Streptomyces sp. ISL-11]
MTTWGLLIETTVGSGEYKRPAGSVITHVDGSRDDALRELETRARSYEPQHPMNPQRRRLFRTTDGYDLIVDGQWTSFLTRFTVAELLADSDPPAPAPEPEPADAAPKPTEGEIPRYPDGVPVLPSWLGRDDLP